ncbi:MAG: hypothetical protein ACTSXG_01440 [Alphaproteobacteria bacterium]
MNKGMLTRLENAGKLKKQKIGIIQIEKLLKQAILDLKEANQILNIADRATYIMAYMAILKAGRAFLGFNGYIPSNGAQHKTVVEASGALLGPKYKDLINHFEIMRRKRNELTYEAGGLISKSECKRAFNDSIALTKGILNEVKKENPQIKLNFELEP